MNAIDHKPGELAEVNLRGKSCRKPEWMRDKSAVWAQVVGYAISAKRGDLDRANKFALAQYRGMYGEWPDRKTEATIPRDPSQEVVNKIRSQMIAYAKGRGARVAA